MRLIIVGASGTIGRHLFTLAKAAGKNVIGTCHSREQRDLIHFDMRKQSLSSVVSVLGTEDVVYILSAYSNPSWIFENQDAAQDLNVTATKRLIDELAQAGSRIIFMSSVEVFDGIAGNYREDAKPNPLNLYGRMKFAIEEYLTQKKYHSCIVRTGWNVGWDIDSRCVIKLTYKTLIQPGAKMARDNSFSIIDAKDTAEGLLRLADQPQIKACHFASAPPVIRTELASLIMNQSQYKDQMGFLPVNFAEIPYSEKRSRLNQLDNSFSISALGMKYRLPKDIIQQKVKLLDQHFEELKSVATV